MTQKMAIIDPVFENAHRGVLLEPRRMGDHNQGSIFIRFECMDLGGICLRGSTASATAPSTLWPGEKILHQATEHHSRLENIGSAAAGIAHDLNNHLTLILNHLETTDVAAAREAASRCCALTASLLSYCRGESVALRPVAVADFLHAFTTGLSLPRNIRWTLDLEHPLPDITADPVAISRVLTNLVNNAVDAMTNGGAVHLRASAKTIEVRDDGTGIPADKLRRIFEPFYSTKGPRGTGLGLAIVREIMRQHGGSVTARSEPGQGAAFTLRFR
jgi:two-component system cell cycle sensor histidine kinase/response regulator CckA